MFKIPRSITRWKSILERIKYIEYIESKILRNIRPDLFYKKISQNSQGNTCVRVSFFIKLQPSAYNFIKK